MLVPAIAFYPIAITPTFLSAFDCNPTRPFSSFLSFTDGDDTAAVSLTTSCIPSRSFPLPSLHRASTGEDWIFMSFIRTALVSCFDNYGLKNVTNVSGIYLGLEECSFDSGESFVEPYARELLSGAIKIRASHHPHLQHCMEIVVLLQRSVQMLQLLLQGFCTIQLVILSWIMITFLEGLELALLILFKEIGVSWRCNISMLGGIIPLLCLS